jgi:hypothetical protein
MKIMYIIICAANIFLVGNSCFSLENIVVRNYKDEKRLSETHNYTFEFDLSIVIGDEKKEGLIKRLIYKNMEMDDYILFREKEFIGTDNENQCPPIIDEGGTEHFYHSNYAETVSINYSNDYFMIIKYDYFFYRSGMAHGYFNTDYYIIDCIDGKILGIEDIINELPDEFLKNRIQLKYDNGFNFEYRNNIWPPDTISFDQNNIILYWNIYSIAPYVFGPVEIVIEYETISNCLTEKGKLIIEKLNKE